MIFIMTADIAAGNATIGDVKWDVARTTPREEFCIPTCNEMRNKKNLLANYTRVYYSISGMDKPKALANPVLTLQCSTSIDIARRCRSLKPQVAADMYLHMKNVFSNINTRPESKRLEQAQNIHHHEKTKSRN